MIRNLLWGLSTAHYFRKENGRLPSLSELRSELYGPQGYWPN